MNDLQSVLIGLTLALLIYWILKLILKVLTIRDKTAQYRRVIEENERWLKEV